MEKTISMQTIMEGLGIRVNDMVLVNRQVLICNDKYDLVKPDQSYCNTIPNLILGMVSGKYDYKVYIPKVGATVTEIIADGKTVARKKKQEG